MSWIRLDDGYLEHPKFRRLLKIGGPSALYLWHGALAWCAQHLTDGVVPADMLDEPRGPLKGKARQRAWDALIECGLCSRDAHEQPAGSPRDARGALVMHDYTDYQPTASKVRVARADAARRKELSRLNKLKAESQCDAPGDGQGGHTPVTAPRARDPHPGPIPSRPDQDLSSSSEPSAPTSDAPAPLEAPEAAKRDGAAKQVAEVFACWQSEHGKQRSKLDAKRTARIKARLAEDFSVEQLCQAIRGAKKDPWLTGADPKASKVFDGIHTILRDAEQVEKLIELQEGKGKPTRAPITRAAGGSSSFELEVFA